MSTTEYIDNTNNGRNGQSAFRAPVPALPDAWDGGDDQEVGNLMTPDEENDPNTTLMNMEGTWDEDEVPSSDGRMVLW